MKNYCRINKRFNEADSNKISLDCSGYATKMGGFVHSSGAFEWKAGSQFIYEQPFCFKKYFLLISIFISETSLFLRLKA